jgi:phosphohistidine phosphatase SixA
MIALVRHADAGRRGGDDDRARPLSSLGREQAANLVRQLGPHSLARVLSSPYLRCHQSVEPLAQARGLEVEDEEVLAEGHSGAEVLELMRGIGPAGGALCSHGDVIGLVLEQLVDGGLIERRGMLFPKGSTWLLELEGDRVIRARYIAPEPEDDVRG